MADNSLPKLSNFINNQFVAPQKGEYLDNFDPSTGQVYSYVPKSSQEDVDDAVRAAKAAFPSWSASSPDTRSAVMLRIADILESRLQEFAEAESRDQGKPITLAKSVDIPRSVHNFRFFATSILHQETKSTIINAPQRCVNYTLREPIGVAGLISPWNLPLYLLSWKIAPAIAMGNTCVCKPSEMTSMTAYMLGEVLVAAGLPAGVVNIVFGDGAGAGSALTNHPDVPLISFTGGTATSEHIIHASAKEKKKLSLELGGKNPTIIFADADLDKCLATSVLSSFANQGEICLCGSRMYVHADIYDEFIKRFVEKVEAFKIGDPKENGTNVGALVSEQHLQNVEKYIAIALKDGGKALTGGKRVQVSDRCKNGYFLPPTILVDVPQCSRSIQEEIFGPVVTISKFSSDDEVVALANGVCYGLAAIVWTENVRKAHTIAHRVQAGTVWVNCWMRRDLRMPFGGGKQSGIGREGQEDSLDFFTEQKVVCVALE